MARLFLKKTILIILTACVVFSGCGKKEQSASGSYSALAGSAEKTASLSEATEEQETTPTPEETTTPEATSTPEATKTPEATPTPEATETPEATPMPEMTEMSEATPTPEALEATPAPNETGEAEAVSYGWHAEERWCSSEEGNIYGIVYIPETEKERVPLVIFSHEAGFDHTSGIPYAERLAEAGYAVYTFDFRGGTVGGNYSDGDMQTLSMISEVLDLEAVLAEAGSWEFVDPEKIILMGGSMGGAVSALTGSWHADAVEAMILLYPALGLPEEMRARFGAFESIPDTFDMFGGYMQVGWNFAADVWDVDPYAEIAAYPGPVLILHGDADYSVDIAYAQRAADVIENSTFRVIGGGGHVFSGEAFESAVKEILRFLDTLT